MTIRNLEGTFQLEAESVFPSPSFTKSKMFLKLRNTAFSNIDNEAKLPADNEALCDEKNSFSHQSNEQ